MLLYWIYRYAFGVSDKRLAPDDEIPDEEKYKEHVPGIRRNIQAIKDAAYERWSVPAEDGASLVGRYYHNQDGAPVVIMFHGYRSSALRDAMGAFRICKECGYNILIVHQRAHLESGGKAITFGIKERYDCLTWIRHTVEKCGPNTEIILIGLSMGASTVMMATGLELPVNVKGVIADCGYSAPKDILKQVIRMMKLPVGIVYPLVRLSARIYGKFDIEGASATEALGRCQVPILFIHGEADDFVPCEMSYMNYDACTSEKELFTVPGAGHGMSYITDGEGYVGKFKGFLQKNFSRHE